MKAQPLHLAVASFVFLAINTSAAVLYVDLNSANPTPPYADWSTAATTIQDAVSQASPGDTVLVTNGVYQTGGGPLGETNRVYVSKTNLTVQSVNGPAVTVIKGYQLPGTTNGTGAVRGVHLTIGATLSGFTVTGGATIAGGYGGGIYCDSSSAVITNCVITGNASASHGGGVRYGTLNNCILSRNVSGSRGGGSSQSQLINCQLINNSANYGGGTSAGSLTNCILVGNVASLSGGGAINPGTMNNCTIVGNSAGTVGGGMYGDGSTLLNCIIYYNTARGGDPSATNIYDLNLGMNFCCTPRLWGKGIGTITNPPAFVDLTGGDYHLQIGSPCMNAGTNVYAPEPTDLDGNPRIVGGRVDMGAYENQFTGAVHYVSLSCTNPVAPYTNWFTAATNLQDAVDAALSGEVVVANSGVYTNGGAVVYGSQTNRVALTNDIRLLGVYGPSSTIIVGQYKTRGAYVGSNAILNGFTITNGQAQSLPGLHVEEMCGGGIWCEPSGAASNCIVSHCSADINYGYGGGMYGGTALNCTFFTNNARNGGGTYLSTQVNCQVISNWATYFGGGAYTGVLYNCTLTGNSCSGDSSGGGGGGARASTLYNCTLTGNRAINSEGGGAYASILYNCTLSSNRATYYGGGGASACRLYNCKVIGNQSANFGGGTYNCSNYNCVLAGNTAASGGGAYQGKLYHCTVVGNSSVTIGGGITGSVLTNCLIYFNTVNSGNISSNWSSGTFRWCCTAPLASGPGNITNAPVFVNPAAGDWRLHFGSPGIDAGTSLGALVTNDIVGNPRPLDGDGDGVAQFDMGACEFDLLGTVGTNWLIGYGLDPNDPLVFTSHPNGHPLTVLQSWVADLNPTNPESLFLVLAVSNGPPVSVSFSNSASRVYTLLANTNLASGWQPVSGQANVPGIGGVMTLQDTNTRPCNFYRVGVSIP